MRWKIPLFKIYCSKEDVKLVSETIKRGMYWAIGPNVEKFERRVSKYIGTKYSVVFNSGTSALHASLLAHDIRAGDEVIVPSFTFIATANAPLFVGARPVFADIEEKTYGLDPADVEKKITKKTRAIIPVHYGGCPCRIKELVEIAESNGLALIEDAAEAFGAKAGDRMIGTFGDSAVFSFCSNKVITTGEGGAVSTNSAERYRKLKLVVSHGRAEGRDYFISPERPDYIELGYNFRMSDITAALGVSQLKRVGKITQMRRKKAAYLTKRLSGLEQVIPPYAPKGSFHVYQMYTIRVREGRRTRDNLASYLNKNGIMTKVFFHPVHQSTFYRTKLGYRVRLPVTEQISSQVLTLPMYPTLTKKEIDFIAEKIHYFFERK